MNAIPPIASRSTLCWKPRTIELVTLAAAAKTGSSDLATTPLLPAPEPTIVDWRTSALLTVPAVHWSGVTATPVPAGWAPRTSTTESCRATRPHSTCRPIAAGRLPPLVASMRRRCRRGLAEQADPDRPTRDVGVEDGRATAEE